MAYTYTVFDTEFGWMAIVASERGLNRLTLPQPAADKALVLISDLLPKATASTRPFRELVHRLGLYFKGEKINFPDELDLRNSTDFQQEVWRLTASIPYGETRAYGWIANELGRPGSVRAVGQAMARNPLPIIIPCHRVVGSNGALGGYSGGLEMKRNLLEMESSGA